MGIHKNAHGKLDIGASLKPVINGAIVSQNSLPPEHRFHFYNLKFFKKNEVIIDLI